MAFAQLFQDSQYWSGLKDRVLREICRTAMCIKRNSKHALLEEKKTNSIPIVINKAGWVSFIWCPLYVIKYRVVQNVI